jgi:hypothetical protein
MRASYWKPDANNIRRATKVQYFRERLGLCGTDAEN